MKGIHDEQWFHQCERQLRRDVATRIKYGFAYVHKPVLDDAPYRVFDTMRDYREWCDRNLPRYLGYGTA